MFWCAQAPSIGRCRVIMLTRFYAPIRMAQPRITTDKNASAASAIAGPAAFALCRCHVHACRSAMFGA